MHRRPSSSVFVAVSALLVALTAAPAAHAGIHYKADTTTRPEHGKAQVTKVEAWVDGPRAKVEFLESDQPMLEAQDYLLTRDGGKTLFLVNPGEKTYAKWDLEGMLALFGNVMESMKGLVNLDFSEPQVEKLAEEPGGSLLGYPTTHYRYRTTYTTKVKILGMHRENTTETVQDLWTTDALGDAGLGVWLRKEPAATGNAQFDKLLSSQMSQIQGFPLKTASVAKTTGQKGKRETTTTQETEVTELETTGVPASTFEIPKGYTETQMMPEGEDQGQGSDSPFGRLFGKKKSGGDGHH